MTAILFVGGNTIGQVSHRRAQLLRMRHIDVRILDTDAILNAANPASRQLFLRTQRGPLVRQFKTALSNAADNMSQGDIVFLDKPIWFDESAVRDLKSRQLRTVAYTPDDPYGPRRDGVWRLFDAALPLYDLHIVPRSVTKSDFESRGARRVLKHYFCFDPRLHRPQALSGNSSPDSYRFIGSPLEDRPQFLLELKNRLTHRGVPLKVNGPSWSHWRYRKTGARLSAGAPFWGNDYRDAMHDALGCIAFITKLNRDEISHKAIETAACGQCPIIEDSEAHRRIFQDGVSAVFFTNVEHCSEKLINYYSKPAALRQIGLQAATAVRTFGLSEDDFLDLMLKEVGFEFP